MVCRNKERQREEEKKREKRRKKRIKKEREGGESARGDKVLRLLKRCWRGVVVCGITRACSLSIQLLILWPLHHLAYHGNIIYLRYKFTYYTYYTYTYYKNV